MVKVDSRFGTIFKREALLTSGADYRIDALILGAKDPFPGYYCSENNPQDSSCKEMSYYLPVYTSTLPSEDYLCRFCLEAKAKLHITSCPARFSLGGKTVKGIRIKNVKPEEVDLLVRFFEKSGLKFYSKKNTRTFFSHIYLKSFFNVKLISDDIYQSADSKDLYYLSIPEPIEWDLFERLFTYQKSKSKFKNYDAALGYWYTQPVFTDFIRIYGKNLASDKLMEIREEFLQNLKAYRESKITI